MTFARWQYLPLAVVLLLLESAIASSAMGITSPYTTSSAASPANLTLFTDTPISNSSIADPAIMKAIGEHNSSDSRNVSDASETASPSMLSATNATNSGKQNLTNIHADDALNSTDITIIGNEDMVFQAIQATADSTIPNNGTESTARNSTGGIVETEEKWIASNGTNNDVMWPFTLNSGSLEDAVAAQLKGDESSADRNSTTHDDASEKKNDSKNIASLRDFLRKCGKQLRLNGSNAQILLKALNSSAIIQQFLTQTKTTTIYVSGEQALRPALWAVLQQKYGSVTSKNGTLNSPK